MSQLSLFVVWQDQNGLSIVSIKLKLQHPCSSLGNDWPGWHIPWLQKCCFEGVCFRGAMDVRMCVLVFRNLPPVQNTCWLCCVYEINY